MRNIDEKGRYRVYLTPEQKEIADKNGVDYWNLNNRLRELGWEVERAITTPIRVRPTRGEQYGQKVLNNLEKHGIKYNTFISRVRNGWSKEEASTTPTLTGKQRGERMTKRYEEKGYKGGLKKEHFEEAKKRGINKLTVYNRVNVLHWTIERAITELPNLERCGYYTKVRNGQLKGLKG